MAKSSLPVQTGQMGGVAGLTVPSSRELKRLRRLWKPYELKQQQRAVSCLAGAQKKKKKKKKKKEGEKKEARLLLRIPSLVFGWLL